MAAQRYRFAAGRETLSPGLVLRRIVCGGQSGVDRAALDAALAADFCCGGWCPAGRLAEDGPIPARYPLIEADSPDPARRTQLNVRDSDATLIVSGLPAHGGTRLTGELAEHLGRPLLVIDIDTAEPALAIDQLYRFLHAYRVETLNVAGPRHTESPAAGRFATQLVEGLLTRLACFRRP